MISVTHRCSRCAELEVTPKLQKHGATAPLPFEALHMQSKSTRYTYNIVIVMVICNVNMHMHTYITCDYRYLYIRHAYTYISYTYASLLMSNTSWYIDMLLSYSYVMNVNSNWKGQIPLHLTAAEKVTWLKFQVTGNAPQGWEREKQKWRDKEGDGWVILICTRKSRC